MRDTIPSQLANTIPPTDHIEEEKHMSQTQSSNDVDLQQAVQLISKRNPHIALSFIAFLMDMPYTSESFDELEFEH